MKERIIIDSEEFIEYFKHTDNDYYEHKVEKQPETFDELKELCKKYNGKGLFIRNNYIEIGGVLMYSNMVFTSDGAIFLNTNCCFKEKVTPSQMWQIIKGLIGEE